MIQRSAAKTAALASIVMVTTPSSTVTRAPMTELAASQVPSSPWPERDEAVVGDRRVVAAPLDDSAVDDGELIAELIGPGPLSGGGGVADQLPHTPAAGVALAGAGVDAVGVGLGGRVRDVELAGRGALDRDANGDEIALRDVVADEQPDVGVAAGGGGQDVAVLGDRIVPGVRTVVEDGADDGDAVDALLVGRQEDRLGPEGVRAGGGTEVGGVEGEQPRGARRRVERVDRRDGAVGGGDGGAAGLVGRVGLGLRHGGQRGEDEQQRGERCDRGEGVQAAAHGRLS